MQWKDGAVDEKTYDLAVEADRERFDADVEKWLDEGIEALDEKYGAQWRSAVDAASLRVEDATCCVLAQIEKSSGDPRDKSFWTAPLSLRTLPAFNLHGQGFVFAGSYPGGVSPEAQDRVTEAWKRRLSAEAMV